MEFHCLPLLFSLSVILMTAQAALPPEVYWERMLPNTPIPKAIRDIPKLGYKEIEVQDEIPFFYGAEKTQSQDQILFMYGTKGTESQDEKKSQLQNEIPFFSDGAEKTQSQDQISVFMYGTKGTESQDEKKTQLQNEISFFSDGAEKTQSQDQISVFMYGTKGTELQEEKKTQVQDGVKSQEEQHSWFSHKNSKSNNKANVVLPEAIPVANHHHNHPKPNIFFSEEGLRPGTKLDTHFPKRKYLTPLLPRQIAERLPFSSEKINEILEIFAVKPKSENVEIVEKAINYCEEPVINGEEKHCATSLESMVDFVTSKLGKNVDVISTEVEKETMSQKFWVKDGVKMISSEDNIIVCHHMKYPYVVFFCHQVLNTSAHFMPLEGEDGSRVKAAAICHKDTSKWNPKYIAFEILKIEPGTAPVCHLMPEGHLLWYAK